MRRLDLTDNERAVLITTLRRLVDFHQVVSFKSPADTPKCPECCGNHGFCAAVPVVRIHLPPAESQQRWLIVSSAIAQESSTAIAIRSRSADRGGRVAPPAADPSQATGRVKGRINQLHRARVLEVRIRFPPAVSLQTIGSSAAEPIGNPGHRRAESIISGVTLGADCVVIEPRLLHNRNNSGEWSAALDRHVFQAGHRHQPAARRRC